MRNTVNERGVRFLVHFTQASNLSSIFRYGILPIDELSNNNIPYNWNDNQRLDKCHNASCFSIESPNYKMFYKYRTENKYADWVVLGIKKEILWEKNCAFCWQNAASSEITRTPVHFRTGTQAFHRLYEEIPNKPKRGELGLSTAIPTNPQSEVLVFGRIEPTYIFSVAFEDYATLEKYNSMIPDTVNKGKVSWLFEPRHDYQYW